MPCTKKPVFAYLNQSVAGLVSACQRLMPLGQTAASQLLWALKPAILEAVDEAEVDAGVVATGREREEQDRER